MKEFFTPAKAYPINPETIAGKYSFDGEDLKKYRDFIHQLRDIYNSHYSALDKAILPDMDKDILLPLFNYHINNVGNPDGNCRYGLETHQFELQLLNEVFLYLNMKPYGREKGSNSFGYFTLGHKEAAIFSIKAAKTRFLCEDAEKIFLLAFGQVPLSVFEAAKLLDVTDISPIATDIIQLEERVQDVLNESVGTGVIFTVNVKKDSSAYDLRRLRGLIKWIRQTFPGEVHIHLTADSILDVHQLAAGRNLFIPAPSSVVYIDTLSISSTHRSHSSFLSGLLLTTVYVQEDFNRNTVPYIGSEDSTVVGSRNGSFLLLDNYFFQRFPFDRLSLLKNKNADYLSHYMKRHGLTPAQADDYAGFDQKLKRLKRQSMGYPINHLWDNSVLNDMFEMLIKEVIMNNTESGLLSSDLKLNHIMSPNGKPYVDEFRDQVLAFYREVFFPYTPDEFDGYITTGGTEGNYIGLFLAKRKFKENGVLFLTPGSHYSISKGASIFELPTEKVNADEIYGCMVRESLETKIREHLETNPNLGVVININMGTTVKGAIDSIAMVKEVLDECGITEENRYIHCDAALHGNILPFLDSAGETMPFTLDPSDKYYAPIDSIAISGHKFVGAPYPCGLGLYRKAELENVRGEILESLESATAGVSGLYPNHAVADYFEMYGTITSGSSNSYMAVAIWKRIRELGREGLTEFARNCIAVTNYTVERMKEVSPITGITPFINKNSNIVILNPCPSKHIMEKWGLPEEQGISHLDIMPHVSTELIDEFIEDLMNMP